MLKPGLESLNWNSLGIPDFIKKCEHEINKFQSLVNQIQKNASMIGRRFCVSGVGVREVFVRWW